MLATERGCVGDAWAVAVCAFAERVAVSGAVAVPSGADRVAGAVWLVQAARITAAKAKMCRKGSDFNDVLPPLVQATLITPGRPHAGNSVAGSN